ncbi:MAG: patatin-like phospholipase family protein [Chthoniobacterales bacterium]|nr:patatin-like phospholipase family protein [Chthoniobacterales bacterium]
MSADKSSQLQESRDALLREVLNKELGGLNTEAWEHLRSAVKWTQLGAGEILFREGDDADSMYVVLSGRLRATKDEDGHTRLVGEITRGETVGEMALLTGGKRSATVQAMRDCVLVGLDNPSFSQLARLCPESVMHVARVQFERIERANRPRSAERLRLSVAVLAADAACDAPLFARRLQTEIGRRGKTALAESANAPAGDGTESDRKARLAMWLNEFEASAQILLMPCGRDDELWTNLCLRSADLVLILSRAGNRPSLEHHSVPKDVKRMLVVLHADGASPPSGTAAARSACGAASHFHLRENTPADFARLARLLSGRAVGISFAGGGARSFCHLGVVRALNEHGIPLDLATGTSLGAIVAAGLSLDLDREDLMDRFRVMVAINPTKRDYLLIPRTSLLSGRKLDRLLPQLLPDTDIEDCWKDFACVSANITNPGAHVHHQGKLLRALRATVSIPGVFPPVATESGELLVDGGVVNNLPADLARDAGAGKLIACDQGGGGASKGKADKPNAMGIIMRSVILHSRISGRAWKTAADLYFESPVADISLLDWESFDLAVKRGYDNARKVLENVDPADWQ